MVQETDARVYGYRAGPIEVQPAKNPGFKGISLNVADAFADFNPLLRRAARPFGDG